MQWFHILRLRLLALVTGVAMLAGCQEVLYSELTEADANEMVALLVLSGIPASRERDKSLAYSVLVDEADVAVAVTVLRNSGLPREKFSSLGEVFGDTGVVGTPFEERIRFAYATNEELSHTITQIKGIESARVHVVIPAEERFGKTVEPARASVAIFHDRSFQPTDYTSKIKTLVAFAVPGLDVENVSTAFFFAPGFVIQQPQDGGAGAGAASAAGQRWPSFGFYPDAGTVFPFLDIAMIVIALLLVRMAVLGWRQLWSAGRQNDA